MKTGNKRFFVFIGGGIGDVLMTTPMFRAIKTQFPDSFIAVSVMGTPQSIVLKNNPHVDDIINLSSKKFSGLRGTLKLIAYLRRNRFQYSLLNHIAERRKFFLTSFLAGIKMRIGYDRTDVSREPSYRYFVKTLTHRLPYTLGVKLRTQLNLDILRVFGITNSDTSYELPAPLHNAKDASTDRKKIIVGIHAGCDGRAELKRWDLQNFIDLGQLIQQELSYEVRFYVGPSEKDMLPVLKKINTFSVVEGLPLESVIADISYCNYFVSNDSGLAHIAAAFKIPTIVLFGPTLKNEYILPTTFIAVENDQLECRPCFHLKIACPINKLCLTSIDATYVFDKFRQLVEDAQGSGQVLPATPVNANQ